MWSREARAAGVYRLIGRRGDGPMALEGTLMTTFMTCMLFATIMAICTEATTLVMNAFERVIQDPNVSFDC